MLTHTLKEDKKKANTVTFKECYDKEWVALLNEQASLKGFQCVLCEQIAHNAIELTCSEHEDYQDALVIGEQCLKQYLNEHNNQCPVGNHDNCNYMKSRTIRNLVDELTVICPRQFESQLANNQTKKENIITETKQYCKYKGGIKKMEDHVDNSCCLKPVMCKFKDFGCDATLFDFNFEQHQKSQMQKHLGLLLDYIAVLQQKLDQYQLKESKQIQEIETLRLKEKEQENEIQMLKNKDNKNISPIEIVLNKREQSEEKGNEIKSVQNHLQQDSFKQCNKITKIVDDGDNDKLSIQSPTFNFDLFQSSSKLLQTFVGHTNWVYCIDYSTFGGDDGDDSLLCSGSEDKTIRIWNIKTTKQIKIFNGHSECVNCVKFSPYHYNCQYRKIVCFSSDDKTIRFWDIKDNKEFQILSGHDSWVGCIQFSPFNCGQYLCSASGDNTIRIWDIETATTLHIFKGHTREVGCIDFSPLQVNNNNSNNTAGIIGGNGYTFCSGSSDGTIRVWDVETLKQLIDFEGHEDIIRSVKYSPYEPNTILSGSEDKTVRLWDIRSKKQISVFNGHTNWIGAVDFSPPFVNNSNVICSGSRDNTIRFWDIQSSKQLHVIKGNCKENDGIWCFKFLPANNNTKNIDCGFNLCYGSRFGPIYVWGYFHPQIRIVLSMEQNVIKISALFHIQIVLNALDCCKNQSISWFRYRKYPKMLCAMFFIKKI
ncbi:hypothetical protein RFI_02458 [Reticulomyxa filosa]|uniref:Uncharacterized protein n=1 Tax=Reticulomyxa filosa TaxID=46433 RepID=X6PAF9_RETFI|nr:hypothetical protein RFI_02458 [Reticulomyxa filosa]|eukprot:ETO34632.1 hypothetical protein RFI_02458 [Reticulomyxa filosa]